MFDKYIYNSLHFIMKHAGSLNAWAWRKHAKMLRAKQQIAMAKLNLCYAIEKINTVGKEGIVYFSEGDEQRMMLMGLKRFTKVNSFNPKNARQLIALKIIEANEYCF